MVLIVKHTVIRVRLILILANTASIGQYGYSFDTFFVLAGDTSFQHGLV